MRSLMLTATAVLSLGLAGALTARAHHPDRLGTEQTYSDRGDPGALNNFPTWMNLEIGDDR